MTASALPRLVVAAPGSGHGKTTVATGLMAALRGEGLDVSGFKVGPDYIDPGYHSLATGRPGRNLDPFLCGEQLMAPLLLHGAAASGPTDVAVIEGVMGLFDGQIGGDGFASTAHVATLTRSPIVLVLDISHTSRTAAALVHGLTTFDPDVRISGVILNKAASHRHTREVSSALEATGVPVVGVLPRDVGVTVPSRHLGLVPAQERDEAVATVDRLASQVAELVDLGAIMQIAHSAPDLDEAPWSPSAVVRAPAGSGGPRPVVAIAGGRAFTFRYAESEELFRSAGLEPVVFDPLTDAALPSGTAGLYLGGGFPEVHAAELTSNTALRTAIRHAIDLGLPTAAECAGLLYLCESVDGLPMVGAIRATATMGPRLSLSYRTAVATGNSLLAEAGMRVTGHEFHRTATELADEGVAPGWLLDGRADGVSLDPAATGTPTLHASYLHVHWAGHPAVAQRFADAVHAFAARGPAVVTVRSTPTPEREAPRTTGTVTLIGGGPSELGLLTVTGLQAIRTADVIVHDRLAPLAALAHARADAEIVDVGKFPRGDFTPQERINALLVEHAQRGQAVVRLKGGDGFVFGRGGEEARACREAGVPVIVVPGVSSSIAAPALAGIPVTHRDLAQGFTVASGHVPPGDPRSTLDWGALARSGTTLVVLMGVATLPAITRELIEQGLASDTPAAVVADAGLASMRTVRAPLSEIARVCAAQGLEPPAVAVIGQVAALDVLA